MLFSGALTVAGGMLGITAFCSFKLYELGKIFRTFALSVFSVYISSLTSRGGIAVL